MVVPAGPPSNVPEVVERLRALEAELGRADGVACFARLYREVTQGVQVGLAQSVFANPALLTRLDVVFAGLFFSALEAHARDPRSAPRAWSPLFEARSRRGIAPLQFAFAGMNAHMNRDLPVALVAVFAELHTELRKDSPEHADFEKVNALLADVEARVKASYLTGWLRAVDRVVHRFHRIDDVIAMWDVRRAREAAWANAEALWALRGAPELSAELSAALDRTVGFAGRGLLVPADSLLQRLARRL